jgi:SAM-dependent methyltransferase
MSRADETYDLSQLQRSESKWRNSPALRAVYGEIFAAIHSACVAGPTLEIGSGIGVAREFFPDWVTSDIVITPYVERAVSAYEIPAEAWANIVAFDVLHHLREPLRFFASAAAALRPGGRLVLAEPAGTAGGRLFYRLVHPEPCRPGEIRAPFVFPAEADGLFANMGMAHALFGRLRPEFETILHGIGLRIIAVNYRDILAYPATGGFSKPALFPAPVLRVLLNLETILPQALLRLIALRMIVVLQKTKGRGLVERDRFP